ncbi:MAG: alpha/beta fold hydrolase [Microbacteriaceae bacterium]|nr:alpha/beta fold hydrolase [Burkholderiaceae bacterium]
MVALWQRVWVIASLVAAAAWLAWCQHAGLGAGTAAAGWVLALLPQAAVLALEFGLLAALGRDRAAPRASAGQLLRAYAGELWAFTCVFSWRQPFRADHEPDYLPDFGAGVGAPGRVAVLLLHGYCCNRGLWAPWLRQLRGRGVPCQALTMAPVFGRIEDWVPAIEAAVVALTRQTGRPPLLVAHSMGGLAVRAWLAARPDADQADTRVQRVVTIGTPHHGTWMARFAHTPNARQMQPGHPWLTALAAGEGPARRARFTCFYGHADNIVFPATSATLEGADNRHLAAVAHVAMAFRPEVIDEVLRLLGRQASDRP